MKKLLCALLAACLLLPGGCDVRHADTAAVTSSESVGVDAVNAVYRITYQWSLRSNNSVGNDWQKVVTCDGTPINSGDTVTAAAGSHITLVGVVTEDDKYPDTGSGPIELTFKDGASGSTRITVREGHGCYAGNAAEWVLSCRVDRIR